MTSVATPLMHRSRRRRRASRSILVQALGLGALAAVGACDGTPVVMDASTPPSARTQAVSLRFDVPSNGTPSLTVLAFRAAFSGMSPADVLGMVDPLAAPGPERDCALRDVDRAVADLSARGDAIELAELTGLSINVGDGTDAPLRPSPRLYPDVAPAIGGVVGEAGPLALPLLPERMRVTAVETLQPAATVETSTVVAVPSAARVTLLNGADPRAGARVETGADLALTVAVAAGAAGAVTIELRPLGATVALVCAVPAAALTGPVAADGTTAPRDAVFLIPRQLVGTLAGGAGGAAGAPVAAALDLVRRADYRLANDGRVSVEVRTSTLVELRP